MLLGMEGVLGRDGPADREDMLLALPPRPYQHRESAYQVGVSKKKSEDRTLATLALITPPSGWCIVTTGCTATRIGRRCLNGVQTPK